MDFSTESVGICFCFLFFPYKAYLSILVVTNTIQALSFTILGILSLLEFDQLILLGTPVSFGLIGLGTYHKYFFRRNAPHNLINQCLQTS